LTPRHRQVACAWRTPWRPRPCVSHSTVDPFARSSIIQPPLRINSLTPPGPSLPPSFPTPPPVVGPSCANRPNGRCYTLPRSIVTSLASRVSSRRATVSRGGRDLLKFAYYGDSLPESSKNRLLTRAAQREALCCLRSRGRRERSCHGIMRASVRAQRE